jgi:hypothetical protein
MSDSTDLRFPIGRYVRPASLSSDERAAALDAIAATPAKLRQAVAGLSDAQLDTPYRPEGWTVRQVVHHLPDSHLNAYLRTKLAITEDNPTIRPYAEARWAQLPEAKTAPVEVSLALLAALHERWLLALRGLAAEDWQRPLLHPETGAFTLEQLIGLYAWHGRHHVAHITGLRERQGWH